MCTSRTAKKWIGDYMDLTDQEGRKRVEDYKSWLVAADKKGVDVKYLKMKIIITQNHVSSKI